MAAAGAAQAEPDYLHSKEAFYRMAKGPLVAQSDAPADVKQDIVDMCQTAVEKWPADVDKCTQAIKEGLDKRFGGPWQVVVGKAFAFEVTHEVKHFMHLFVGGTTGVLVWSC